MLQLGGDETDFGGRTRRPCEVERHAGSGHGVGASGSPGGPLDLEVSRPWPTSDRAPNGPVRFSRSQGRGPSMFRGMPTSPNALLGAHPPRSRRLRVRVAPHSAHSRNPREIPPVRGSQRPPLPSGTVWGRLRWTPPRPFPLKRPRRRCSGDPRRFPRPGRPPLSTSKISRKPGYLEPAPVTPRLFGDALQAPTDSAAAGSGSDPTPRRRWDPGCGRGGTNRRATRMSRRRRRQRTGSDRNSGEAICSGRPARTEPRAAGARISLPRGATHRFPSVGPRFSRIFFATIFSGGASEK